MQTETEIAGFHMHRQKCACISEDKEAGYMFQIALKQRRNLMHRQI